MGKDLRITLMLVVHFFRRFFDNDTLHAEGDTLTTVIRAISFVAAPGLFVAFFLQNDYWRSSLWGTITDQYFFVLISFVVMGAVAIFEWEMLFPDRLDFLALTPLSLKPMQLLAAKAFALVAFLALFLASCNSFGALILPALRNGSYFRQLYPHLIAVLLAGIFAAFFFLALGGVLLCVLGAARFRIASPIVQMLSVMGLVLLMLHYARYGDALQTLLSNPQGIARWMPPLWFLGLYQQMLNGATAPAFAHQMAHDALQGTWIAAALTVLTYPLAWARMRKMAFEGAPRRRGQPSRWSARLVHALIRRPEQRAAFHFIGQTIARNNRYQVYLAMYCGTGLALAIACAVTLRAHNGRLQPMLSDKGLHAMMPLLLFWVIAGLRTAFAFPLNLPARWVFRITGVNIAECASAARRWVLLCAISTTCCILALLRAAGWDLRRLLVQAVCGLCLCIFLTDGFFLFQQKVPFNQPRMPGKTSLPLMLTLYIGVFPLFIFGVIYMETQIEKHPMKLFLLAAVTAAIHIALIMVRGETVEVEEEMEGYEGEFQLLNLSWR